MRTKEAMITKPTWIPRKERIGVYAALAASVLLVLWGLWNLIHVPAAALHSRSLQRTLKNYGSNAEFALFFVLANYALAFLIKKRLWDQWGMVKKGMIALLQFVRRWHTPIAIVAIAFILLHVVAVFMYGFKFDFNNISGLLALLALLPVPVSGLFRYRRLDRKWHLRSGLAFAVLFLIHAFL